MGQLERDRYNLPRRNYTVQVEQADKAAPHFKKPEKAKVKKVKRPGLLYKSILSVLVLGILVIIALVIWRNLHQPKDPIPASIKKSVSFPLYYPTSKPKGYTLDPVSIVNSSGTIFYNLVKNPGDKPIVISQQPIPKKFDPKSMFQHSSLPTTISPLGTIYDLSYKNQSRFMVAAPDSLIFISSSAKITNSQLQQIVEGLKASK